MASNDLKQLEVRTRIKEVMWSLYTNTPRFIECSRRGDLDRISIETPSEGPFSVPLVLVFLTVK